MTQPHEDRLATATLECAEEGAEERSTAAGSTLIEFPGARNVPQWRKELSERVREIQQRRAREAAPETEEVAHFQTADAADAADADAQDTSAASHLGLVPSPPEAPEVDPRVANALRRIERARQNASHPVGRAGGRGRGAATAAVARVAEEHYDPRAKPQTAPAPRPEHHAAPVLEQSNAPEAKTSADATAARAPALVAVPAQVTSKVESATGSTEGARAETSLKETLAAGPPAQARAKDEKTASSKSVGVASAASASLDVTKSKPAPRRVADAVIDDAWLSRLEEKILPPVNAATRTDDDIAPLVPRVAAGLLDLLLVAFISSPFAAVIELTNGNWADPRVAASMGGIVLTVMFLYLTVSTALAGRTVAMALFGLHTVDAETALAPRLGQCARRTLVYMLSLAAFGLGILYALFDAEHRAAHDHLSGTVVVRALK